MTRYLYCIWCDVESEILGPYKSDKTRDRAAHNIVAREGSNHGLFKLDIINGKPQTSDYCGAFFDDYWSGNTN